MYSVNVQVAEVYFDERRLMPVPEEVAMDNDWKARFGNELIHCTLTACKTHMQKYHIAGRGVDVIRWSELPAGKRTVHYKLYYKLFKIFS